MTLNLGKYVNKTILVSIPSFSGDVKCRAYKLMGVELIGLWLEGADLAEGFLVSEHKKHPQATWAFFVPFSQIACVAVGMTAAVTPADSATSSQQRTTPAPSAATERESSSTGGAASPERKKK